MNKYSINKTIRRSSSFVSELVTETFIRNFYTFQCRYTLPLQIQNVDPCFQLAIPLYFCCLPWCLLHKNCLLGGVRHCFDLLCCFQQKKDGTLSIGDHTLCRLNSFEASCKIQELNCSCFWNLIRSKTLMLVGSCFFS